MSKPITENDITIPDNILKELLTASEIRMLKNRWQILNLLSEGLSVRKIAEKVKVGTDTVVRVIRMSEKSNLKISNKKLEIKSQTPWIFGKNG